MTMILPILRFCMLAALSGTISVTLQAAEPAAADGRRPAMAMHLYPGSPDRQTQVLVMPPASDPAGQETALLDLAIRIAAGWQVVTTVPRQDGSWIILARTLAPEQRPVPPEGIVWTADQASRFERALTTEQAAREALAAEILQRRRQQMATPPSE